MITVVFWNFTRLEKSFHFEIWNSNFECPFFPSRIWHFINSFFLFQTCRQTHSWLHERGQVDYPVNQNFQNPIEYCEQRKKFLHRKSYICQIWWPIEIHNIRRIVFFIKSIWRIARMSRQRMNVDAVYFNFIQWSLPIYWDGEKQTLHVFGRWCH